MSTSAYRYKAIDDAGEVVEGALNGESEDAVAAKLQASGFMPIRIVGSRPRPGTVPGTCPRIATVVDSSGTGSPAARAAC